MITQHEIQTISEWNKLPKSQIDKDWVLSYLLLAITLMPEMPDILVFKGGTCIKKCYIPDYRFSEDLDFTLLDKKFIFNKRYINEVLEKATNLSFNETFNRGILFKLKEIEPTQSNDEEQGFKIYINYWGADHKKNDLPSDKSTSWHHTIKLDINHTEEIIFPIIENSIKHHFSDKDKFSNTNVKCYSLPEMLSEKMRSLIQRKYTSPRDCYDIWYLKNNFNDLNWKEIKKAFFRKCESKNIKFENVAQLINPRKEKILKQHWKTQLLNQFPKDILPEAQMIIEDLKIFFYELFNS